MKRIILFTGLAILLSLFSLVDIKASPAVNSAVVAAQKEGRYLAGTDFTNGVYRLQTYGLGSGKMSPAEEYLKKNYNVSIWPVAACVVSQELVVKAKAYNSLMKELLIRKFGKDIFEEAKKATAVK